MTDTCVPLFAPLHLIGKTHVFYGRGTTTSITVIRSPPLVPTRDWVMRIVVPGRSAARPAS